jgi:hypothetical protein
MILLDLIRLRNEEKGQCKIDKAVLELIKSRETLGKLVYFGYDGTRNHSSSRSNSRNNSSSNHFGLAQVALGNFVVSGTQDSDSVNVVNVEVSLVIFFELSWLDSVLINFTADWNKFGHQLIYDFLIIMLVCLFLGGR